MMDMKQLIIYSYEQANIGTCKKDTINLRGQEDMHDDDAKKF